MKIKGLIALIAVILCGVGIAFAVGPATFWTEVKPIIGPLLQAIVVLAVGYYTIGFQRRQAKTAERKLFADIHDKRYKALTSFIHDVREEALNALNADDAASTPMGANELQRRGREMSARMQELGWLFGSDLMQELNEFRIHATGILTTINRVRHNLTEDQNSTVLVDTINDHVTKMYQAMAGVVIVARNYLYVGSIKMSEIGEGSDEIYAYL